MLCPGPQKGMKEEDVLLAMLSLAPLGQQDCLHRSDFHSVATVFVDRCNNIQHTVTTCTGTVWLLAKSDNPAWAIHAHSHTCLWNVMEACSMYRNGLKL